MERKKSTSYIILNSKIMTPIIQELITKNQTWFGTQKRQKQVYFNFNALNPNFPLTNLDRIRLLMMLAGLRITTEAWARNFNNLPDFSLTFTDQEGFNHLIDTMAKDLHSPFIFHPDPDPQDYPRSYDSVIGIPILDNNGGAGTIFSYCQEELEDTSHHNPFPGIDPYENGYYMNKTKPTLKIGRIWIWDAIDPLDLVNK